jgi:hypothetical protein
MVWQSYVTIKNWVYYMTAKMILDSPYKKIDGVLTHPAPCQGRTVHT